MRLIDADALKERLQYSFFDITATPATSVVDAAPTVYCERCEHYDREASHGWDDCVQTCLDCWCGSNFKEVTP